jgi:hypothetical protein
VRGLLALGALFVVAFVLTRANPNAGFFLFLAVVCVGVALVSLFARGLQQLGGTIRSRTGGSERDLVLGGLLLITLLTPWAVAVPTLGFRQIFGWQSPLALLVVVALVAARLPGARRLAVPALLVAGLGLVAWAAWATAQLLMPAFRHSGFGLLPIDLVGEGWYIALLALVISVDRLAVEETVDDQPARSREVWPFAVVPGMGLVRMRYLGRGRLWAAAFGFCVFLLQTTAVGAEEFQYYGSLRSLPEPRARGVVLVPLVLGLLAWLVSLWDTRQRLRIERYAGVTALSPRADPPR